MCRLFVRSCLSQALKQQLQLMINSLFVFWPILDSVLANFWPTRLLGHEFVNIYSDFGCKLERNRLVINWVFTWHAFKLFQDVGLANFEQTLGQFSINYLPMINSSSIVQTRQVTLYASSSRWSDFYQHVVRACLDVRQVLARIY